ncbi:MAG: hypothetical protein ACKO8O_10170, partial [Betaproteobacteria bacterium]
SSVAGAGSGVQVYGAVYQAPALLASFEPGLAASGEAALQAIEHQAGFSVGELWQSAPVAAEADNRWPAFQGEIQGEIDPERFISFTLTPISTQSGDKLVRVASIEMTTRSFQGQGARHAALAHSGDGFSSYVTLELDPSAKLETLRFDLGNLQVKEETEFRIHVWGMAATPDADGNPQGSDAEYLTSSTDARFSAGLRIHGWVENQPPEPIEASIGQLSARTVISVPGTLNELPESQRALLAKAGPDDIVDVRYQRWEYLGENTTLDLADENAFVSPSLWRKVAANETRAADALPVLSSTDGFADVTRGQWVEDRRTIRAITLQIVSDIDVAATGMFAANSEGALVLSADGDLQIDNGSRSGLTISGLSAAGDLRVQATGGIYVVDSLAITGAVIRAGGDITLIAAGSEDTDGNSSAIDGGVLRVGSKAITGADGKPASEMVVLPLAFDLPASAVLKVDAAGDVSLDRLSREARGEASTLRTGGINAGGNLTLKVSDGSIFASGRGLDTEVIHLSGKVMSLDVIDTP